MAQEKIITVAGTKHALSIFEAIAHRGRINSTKETFFENRLLTCFQKLSIKRDRQRTDSSHTPSRTK